MAIVPITKIYKFDKDRHIKSIVDFTGKYYYIDELGNLYYRNTLLKSDVNQYGYIGNTLKDINGKSCYVLRHQIVAQCFLMNEYQDGYTVDHIDRNKTNNKLENLRWANQKQQIQNQNRRIVSNKITNEVYEQEQKYELLIPDQRQYFIDNQFPKFDKIKYKKLYRIYQLYDYVVFGNEKDDILEKYDNEFIENNGSFVLDRELFYDFCYKKVNKYLEDKGKEIAFKTNENSLDINLIMKKFVDKEYNKKEFKEFCIKNFSIKEEVFKNKNTIDIFLRKIGMCLKRGKTGSILRKL